MEKIIHRVNKKSDLVNLDKNYGVEIDLRSWGKDLIINHDPFLKGEYFEEWIKFYDHKTLILNVKEEGLEDKILEILKSLSIDNFFFLDQSFPFIKKYAFLGEKRCAIRVSEFESLETVLNMKDMVEWVWVDCFTKFPINFSEFKKLKDYKFKLCIVSPELQGRFKKEEIINFKKKLINQNIVGDAVCTKYPNLWE